MRRLSTTMFTLDDALDETNILSPFITQSVRCRQCDSFSGESARPNYMNHMRRHKRSLLKSPLLFM